MVILIGMIYLAVGLASAELAKSASSERLRFLWRLSPFIISGVVFVAHIFHEQFRGGNTVKWTALRAALAVAVGAFALALIANIHDLGSATGYRPRMLIAFVAWPLLTGVPAFVSALVLAFVLGIKHPNNSPRAS
jgi:hypothetical protein